MNTTFSDASESENMWSPSNEGVNKKEDWRADLTGISRLVDSLPSYSNPLLDSATELLGVLVTIPRQGYPIDIARFRQYLLDGIIEFRQKGALLDYHPNVIDKACFVLCAAFDEAILYSPWGNKVQWENHSLLSAVFSERNGGEIFYNLLDKACEQPGKLIDFIELQYILLMLGFHGKYRHQDESELHEIKSDVYYTIYHYRDEVDLPVPKTPELPKSKTPWHFFSVNKMLASALLVLLLGYGASEYWYFNRSQSLIAQYSGNQVPLTSTEQLDLIIPETSSSKIDESSYRPSSAKRIAETSMSGAQWELLLAVFSSEDDANYLADILRQDGFNTELKLTDEGVELVSEAASSLPEIRQLKEAFDVQFDLNSTIRKAKK